MNPTTPQIQARYTGGQAMPAYGTSEYAQAQALASTPTPSAPAVTPATPSGSVSTRFGVNQSQISRIINLKRWN